MSPIMGGAGYISKPVKIDEKVIKRSKVNSLLEQLPMPSPLIIFDRNPSPVACIKWCPDNIHIATSSVYENPVDNLVRIWNTKTGALIHGIGSGEEIKDFAWAPDGKRIAITHHDNSAWVCDLSNVFKIEHDMESLSLEQLEFMELFFAEQPLTSLSKKQKSMLNKFPKLLKEDLMDQLEMFNKKGDRANPLR